MIRELTNRLLTSALVLAAAGFAVPNARADAIYEIGGTNQAFTLSSDNLTLGSAQTNQMWNQPGGGTATYQGLNYTTSFSNSFGISSSGTTSNGTTTYALTSNGVQETINFGNGGSAVFALTGGTATVSSGAPNVLILQGTLSLVSATNVPNGWNFNAFTNGSDYTITLVTDSANNNFNSDIDSSSSSSVSGTGAWNETAAPEPGSLLLLGLGSLGMVGWTWKRRQVALA